MYLVKPDLFLCPGEVGPLVVLDVLYLHLLLVLPLRCVGHPQLVTLEYLCSAAFPAARPAAVTLPVAE